MTEKKPARGFLYIVSGCAVSFVIFSFIGVSCASLALGAVSDNAGFSTFAQTSPVVEVLQKGSSQSPQKIALIKLSGTLIGNGASGLYSNGISQQLEDMLKLAKDDPMVAGVLLWVDSPGGSVTDSDIILEKIKTVAKEKPVLFLMDDICASGCVYAAIGATEIWALPTTITGSIGVIIQGLNVSEFLNRHGIQDHSITSGKHKALLSPTRPVNEESTKIVQGIVDSMYARFVSLIEQNRNLSMEAIKLFADGRIFTADQAKEFQLIDEVGTYEAALQRLQEMANTPSDVQIVRYKHQPTIYEFLQQNLSGGSFEAEMVQYLSVWPRVMLLPRL
jgi:protease IV